MTRGITWRRDHAVFAQLCWFVRLRWMAGGVVVAGGLMDYFWLRWYPQCLGILVAGLGILACNVLFRALLRPGQGDRWPSLPLLTMAAAQTLMDLLWLTLLAAWTGGAYSPLIAFFVFHMVIASLLLPRVMAYATAGISCVMMGMALWLTGQWPAHREESFLLAGWMVAMIITVYLASNIRRSLAQHRRRVLQQRRRIRAMSTKLHRQTQVLFHQEKMAAMGQMAAGVAHEIANPLACMDSLLQLAQRKPDHIEPDAILKLRQQISRINDIIRQLTNFAYPGQAQRETQTLSAAVTRAVEMVSYHRRYRDAQTRVDLDESINGLAIHIEPHAIEQILINLIMNALDAMAEQPSPQLRIHAFRRADQGIIEVIDNGHGIAPEHLAHLFEPFFTTKPLAKGTGLGLAISDQLIRRHGGRIEAANRQDASGAVFTVYIPISLPPGSQK